MFEDKRSLNREEKRIREQASNWLVERDAGWEADREVEFEAWKSEDIRHEIAIRDLEATWNRMMQLREVIEDPTLRPNLDILTPQKGSKHRSSLGAKAIVGSLAAILVLGLAFWSARESSIFGGPAGPATYSTTFNDYKQVGLEDGSILELNASSRVEIEFSENQRKVHLLRGEAHFQVAKDSSRPFLVDVGGIAVQAVGTAFNVRYGADEIQVLVTEGRVAVNMEKPPSNEESVSSVFSTLPELIAGDKATISTGGDYLIPMVSNTSEEEYLQILAWKGPRLFFDATPLREAVSQFNEHNMIQIRIEDEEIKELSIGGSFLVEDVEAFIRLLASEGTIQVERPDFDSIVLRNSD